MTAAGIVSAETVIVFSSAPETKNAADTDANPKADLRKKYFTFFLFPLLSPFLFNTPAHIKKPKNLKLQSNNFTFYYTT